VSAQAGVNYAGTSKVSSWADIDNDGDADLYVGNRDEADLLYINQGDGTFLEEAATRGINNLFATSSVLFSDINRDGWLDLYIGNVNNPNVLYINNGGGYFTDHTQASGATDQAVAMGSVFFDYDLDGDDDLYLTHDAQVPYILYENMGDATFTNVSADANVNYAGFGMGADVGDFNLDGYMDIYITNLYDNVLYKNNGDGTFENVAPLYGVNNPGMGWGNVWGDFDNDRRPDIYVVNDYYFSPDVNVLYRNTGTGFEIASAGDPCESPFAGYATVAADLNDDGRLDLLVANNGAPGVQLFQNTTSDPKHYISFHLEGVESNRDALGAKIEVYTATGIQYDQVIGNSGWAADNGRWIHFGLGHQQVVDNVIIRWPSGLVQQFDGVWGDQKYRIREGEGLISAAKEIKNQIKSCRAITGDDELNISFSGAPNIKSLTITDMSGRSIPTTYTQSEEAVNVALPSLPSGVYQVMVVQPEEVCVSRFWHGGVIR
ncbi:MAG TPA: FG-GAP-like repeat-containing protein, partial [Saprospiraceae bacterium]|nr:FG-GAP-like repeat-containing protein [Saprospiraceae bacterium]